MPADRVRPGVQALPRQLLAQPGDQLHGGLRDRRGCGPRPPGRWLERSLTHRRIAGQQSVDPGPATPYLRATSLTGRFSAVTAVMTRRAFDIRAASWPPAR
jgi:hypothetical protein